jgi:hypothetical protein
MGGFVSDFGHHPITTPDTVPKYLDAIRAVHVEDIQDKSKGDALSKGIALAQGAWFMTQCFARLAQNLPVSELEVATLAFAIVNVFIWLLWRNKPLDVQRPIMVTLDDQYTLGIGSPHPQNDWSIQGRLAGVMTGNYHAYDPAAHTYVPSFWSCSGNQDKNNFAFYIECLVGTIFGAIHCTVWNADFPSTVEMQTWRSCALLVTTIPVILALSYAAMDAVMGTVLIADDSGLPTLLVGIPVLSLLIYPIARLFLIMLPLIALRALAAGSLMDVNWSVYIPHL